MENLIVIPLREFGEKWIMALGVLVILDFAWAYHTKARYFSLHGVWNIIITILIIPDLYKTLLDPMHALTPGNDVSRWPIIMVAVIHFWHCVGYSGLTFDDYFHHIVFATGLCAINFIWDWGYSTNFILFFICGLPGGLDYLMLAGVKHGYIRKISEKRINKLLNVWCRGPGCIASGCLIWINWMSNQTNHIPSFVKMITIILSISNGQYYSRRVVASWAIHESMLKQQGQEKEPKPEKTPERERIYCVKCKNELKIKVMPNSNKL